MRPDSLLHPVSLVLLAAVLAGCSSAPAAAGAEPATEEPRAEEEAPVPESSAGEELAFTTIEQGSVPGKAGEQVRAVVRDDVAWLRVWNDLTSGRGGPARADATPAVDFDTSMVIAAAMPTQSCISRVTVRAVRAVDDGLVVDLLEQPPPPGLACFVSERPFHAVRLGRRDGPVRWEVETRPLDPEAPAPSRPPSQDR